MENALRTNSFVAQVRLCGEAVIWAEPSLPKVLHFLMFWFRRLTPQSHGYLRWKTLFQPVVIILRKALGMVAIFVWSWFWRTMPPPRRYDSGRRHSVAVLLSDKLPKVVIRNFSFFSRHLGLTHVQLLKQSLDFHVLLISHQFSKSNSFVFWLAQWWPQCGRLNQKVNYKLLNNRLKRAPPEEGLPCKDSCRDQNANNEIKHHAVAQKFLDEHNCVFFFQESLLEVQAVSWTPWSVGVHFLGNLEHVVVGLSALAFVSKRSPRLLPGASDKQATEDHTSKTC